MSEKKLPKFSLNLVMTQIVYIITKLNRQGGRQTCVTWTFMYLK